MINSKRITTNGTLNPEVAPNAINARPATKKGILYNSIQLGISKNGGERNRKSRTIDKTKVNQKKTLSDMVVDEIINLLVTGRLKPGDKLPSQIELVKMLNGQSQVCLDLSR